MGKRRQCKYGHSCRDRFQNKCKYKKKYIYINKCLVWVNLEYTNEYLKKIKELKQELYKILGEEEKEIEKMLDYQEKLLKEIIIILRNKLINTFPIVLRTLLESSFSLIYILETGTRKTMNERLVFFRLFNLIKEFLLIDSFKNDENMSSLREEDFEEIKKRREEIEELYLKVGPKDMREFSEENFIKEIKEWDRSAWYSNYSKQKKIKVLTSISDLISFCFDIDNKINKLREEANKYFYETFIKRKILDKTDKKTKLCKYEVNQGRPEEILKNLEEKLIKITESLPNYYLNDKDKISENIRNEIEKNILYYNKEINELKEDLKIEKYMKDIYSRLSNRVHASDLTEMNEINDTENFLIIYKMYFSKSLLTLIENFYKTFYEKKDFDEKINELKVWKAEMDLKILDQVGSVDLGKLIGKKVDN